MENGIQLVAEVRATEMSLAGRLRRARLEADMTQERVAELAGVERNTIWRYEAGVREPSASTLNLLSRIYEKPVTWFWEESESPDPNAHGEVPDPDYEADLELVMNEASLALRQVSDRLSPEAIKSIADYIRFVDEREERERRESEGPG